MLAFGEVLDESHIAERSTFYETQHGLQPMRLEDIAQWNFADWVFRQTYDIVSSTTKLRRAGFHEAVDTEEMFLDHLARYREARILP